ncbi:F-box SKIP23-like protein (DUF295) [Rhynchospora pubera]|uniref:F-box SKIP23-like protein (DUF295) n=1 Tax=Rhynchospora pubera TaxID=906938 RepID=A0AAV8GWT8_9POAL|nr:F-box SKIP23-like protein (DUF295) [Rhynchospora pubera]
MGAVQSQSVDQSKLPQAQLGIISSESANLTHLFTRDWSDLPVDILSIISTKLPILKDVIHFRAICKSWRSAVPLSDPLPRPPWIFMDDECIPRTLTFFSLDSFNYCIDISKIEGMQLVGTTYKHMVVLDEANNSMFLLNPITKKLVPLPPFGKKYPRAHHIGVETIQSEDLVVIRVKLPHELVLLLCRPGDKEWKMVEVPDVNHGHIYHKGMYYINSGSTMVVDIDSSETMSTIPPPIDMTSDMRFSYLIENFGDLLGVWKNKLWCGSVNEYRFGLYKLENRNQQPQWIKMNNIGDRILFLNSSTGFCFRAGDFPGFKENCIYFFSARFKRSPIGPQEEFFDLCKYDIKTDKTEELKSIATELEGVKQEEKFWVPHLDSKVTSPQFTWLELLNRSRQNNQTYNTFY